LEKEGQGGFRGVGAFQHREIPLDPPFPKGEDPQ
jgi:hypothetical protein